MCADSKKDFVDIRARLERIAAQVHGEEIGLDEALDLYDEAVSLGIEAAELLEHVDVRQNSKSEQA